MELETQLNASDRNTRAIIGNNFQKIQEEDSKDDATFEKFQKETNTRLDQLEQEKATKDDLETAKSELLGRIKSIYLGEDHKAIRDIILDMKEKGEI